MSWAMTDGEISAMWRGCKDRNEQVNILADLNVKSRKEVLDKLRELQCDMRGVRTGNNGGGAPKKPPMDELMETVCDKCRYPLEVGDQEQLGGICAGCTIREEIENLMNQ